MNDGGLPRNHRTHREPVLYVPRWQYDAMMRDLRERGLPETHEQLVKTAVDLLGPCTIAIYEDDEE